MYTIKYSYTAFMIHRWRNYRITQSVYRIECTIRPGVRRLINILILLCQSRVWVCETRYRRRRVEICTRITQRATYLSVRNRGALIFTSLWWWISLITDYQSSENTLEVHSKRQLSLFPTRYVWRTDPFSPNAKSANRESRRTLPESKRRFVERLLTKILANTIWIIILR